MSDSHVFLRALESENLRRKLFWVSLLRVLTLLALISGTIFLLEGSKLSTLVSIRRILILVGFITLIPSFFYFPIVYSIKTLKGLMALAYVQVLQDMLFATLLILLTGGTSSAFTFFFSLNVIRAGILLFRKGAVYGVILAYLLMLWLAMVELKLIPGPAWLYLFVMPTSKSSVLYNLVINLVAITSIGVLSSYLSEQIHRSDLQKEELRLDLEDLMALHEHILASMNNGLITCDREWNIVYINPYGTKILNIDFKTARTKQLMDLVDGIEEYLHTSDNRFDIHVRNQSGSIQILHFRISPLRPRLHQVPGYVILFDDVTRVRELEAKMLAEHRLVTIGKLAAVVAHEIRNPQASISGAMQILSSKFQTTEDGQKLISIVLRETERLNQWITDLLNYARPAKAKLIPLDICKLGNRVLELFRMNQAAKDIDITFSCDDAWINGDEERLSQVMTNLLNNAVEAIHEAGITNGKIIITVRSVNKEIVCRIEDNGPGIREEDMQQVFQPFFTTKKTGTGLGLSVVEQVILEHQGRINVRKSELGGACFQITFPEVQQ